MCVVSMVMQTKTDEWARRWIEQQPSVTIPTAPTYIPPPLITPAEIAEFRILLERARQYDREHNQPDCELQEKRDALKELARKMGCGELEFV